jgi:hypothetical protein
MNLSYLWTLIAYSAGFFARESDFCRGRCPPFSVFLIQFLRAYYCGSHMPQAAKDVRSSEGILVDIFERLENFFHRLEVYTALPPTPEMMDMMVKIMVEVLFILGIATKEIRQGRTSE